MRRFYAATAAILESRVTILCGALALALAAMVPNPGTRLLRVAVLVFAGAVLLALLLQRCFERADHTHMLGLEKAGWRRLDAELDRARRYSRRLSVVRVRLHHERQTPPMAVLLGELAGQVRRDDVIWLHRGDVFVLLPEAGRTAAGLFTRRLSAALEKSAHTETLRVVTVTFPEDGVTSGALLAALSGKDAPRIVLADAGRVESGRPDSRPTPELVSLDHLSQGDLTQAAVDVDV